MNTRLKTIRLMRNLTQSDVANATGIKIGTLRNWEQGVFKPDSDGIIALSRLYDVSTDTLMGTEYGDDILSENTGYKNNLRFCRHRCGLTQKQVADALRITPTAYQNYEAGRRDLKSSTLIKLHDILGCSTDEILIGGDGVAPIVKDGDRLQHDKDILTRINELDESVRDHIIALVEALRLPPQLK